MCRCVYSQPKEVNISYSGSVLCVLFELFLFVILSVVDVGFINAERVLPSGRVPPGEVLGFQTVTELMKEPEVDHR